MSILVLQSSWLGRESWMLCFICLPGVSWWLSGSSSRCHGVVCGLWLWYFLIILTYYFCHDEAQIILALKDICSCCLLGSTRIQIIIKVERKAKIRNRYNQVQQLTRNNIWESGKNTSKHNTQESQEVSPFPAGDHKAARNRLYIYSITKTTRVAADGTPLQIPAFLPLTFTLGSRSHKMWPSTLYIRSPLHLQSLKLLHPKV